jgi:NADP-dependent 3-hydroxy acid dehydrogenase YdfG
MSDFSSRVALVTGASSGIGEALVRKFVASGIAVVGNARNAAKLQQLQDELGPRFIGVSGDAADNSLISSLFDKAIEYFAKPVDLVVVNAGRGLGGSVQHADLVEFEAVLKINVSGALALMQQAAVRLVAHQKNHFPDRAADIVVIGSVAGRNISPFSAVYGSSKFAVHALAEGLRREIGPEGVRVTLVEPGIVLSGFQKLAGYSAETVAGFHNRFGPLLETDDVANTIHSIVSLAPHIHVSDVVIRPTRQDYP